MLLSKLALTALTAITLALPLGNVVKADHTEFNCFSNKADRPGYIEYEQCTPGSILVASKSVLNSTPMYDAYRLAMTQGLELAAEKGEYSTAKFFFNQALNILENIPHVEGSEECKSIELAIAEAQRAAKAANNAAYANANNPDRGYSEWVEVSGVRSSVD